MRKPYIIYKRTEGKKSPTYYVKFWEPRLQEYVGKRSIASIVTILGDDAGDLRPTSNAASEELVRRWLAQSVPTNARDPISDRYYDYLSTFWEVDGEFARSKAAAGEPHALEYLLNNAGNVANHILPWLAADLARSRTATVHVAPGLLESLIAHLDAKQLSTRTVNAILQSATVPLSEFWRKRGQPERNPARLIRRPTAKKSEQMKRAAHRIFTFAEAKAFFEVPMGLRIRGINALAASTGQRVGECLGLLVGDIIRSSVDGAAVTLYEIDIAHNFQQKEGLKDPKTGSFRRVPVPNGVGRMLDKLIAENPWGNDFVFYGHSRSRPMGRSTVDREFRRICDAIGIDEAQRVHRSLEFHSWRHWYRSMLDAAGISPRAGDALTGHRQEATGRQYTEVTEEQRRAVAQITARLF